MDRYVLVEYLTTINTVISETFKSTQRIKITSFDVSNNYIILGASSGGIYIFKREPCEFVKIIPSKEGSALKIRISPNEKNLAITSAKGIVIILENIFVDLNLRPLIYTEHEGNIVTEMKWHGNLIYCGDDVGKISVCALTNLLAKTVFQSSSSILMHLDSCIIQLDIYLNYMLISTKTRTYLCDTEKEQYKQIGKKLRDGEFGACFSTTINTELSNLHQCSRGIFKTMKEDEIFMTTLNNNEAKIYCARPGVRLWEANFEASVLVTHQFRNALDQCPSDILLIKDDSNARLNISSLKDVKEVPKNFNLGRIYPFAGRFIFTYDAEGIYFFDFLISNLAFWSNSFKNVRDIRIVNSNIYIWSDSLQINIISLSLLEELLIKTLLEKQYYLCAELCVYYKKDVINLIEESKKIHLITILKSKLHELNALDLLEKLEPILNILEQCYKKQSLGKILDSGIVVVENVYMAQNSEFDNYVPVSVQNFNVTSNIINLFNKSTKEIKGTLDILEGTVKKIVLNNCENFSEEWNPSDTFSSSKEENDKMLCLYNQYKLNKTHKTAELTESSTLLESLNLVDMFKLLENFITHVKEIDNEDATNWCQEQTLKRASREDCDIESLQPEILIYLTESYLEVNKSDTICKCNFPLPNAHKKKPMYYKLGCKLFDQLKDKKVYLLSIPYMYKYKLTNLHSLEDVHSNLSLLIQYSDKDLLKQFITKFTYDSWDEIIKMVIKLKREVCLNCEKKIDLSGLWTWTDVGLLIIESIGPQNASRTLTRYSEFIPNGDLDSTFYQCCILAATVDVPKLAVNFMTTINDSTSQKFEELMEKFLQKKYMGNQCQVITPTVSSSQVSKCTFCSLPLNGSILTEVKQCEYGHNFHSICFTGNNYMCNICMPHIT